MGVGSANPLLLATAASGGGASDPVTRSLRFGSGSYLSRTFGTPTDAKKKTISVWVKRSKLNDSNGQELISYQDSNAGGSWQFSGAGGGGSSVNDDFVVNDRNATTGTSDYMLRTKQLFRDPAAWYHIFIRFDTTDSTAADRCQIWVNGERVTDWNTGDLDYPDLNYVTTKIFAATTGNQYIGTSAWDTGGGFEGYMADFYFTDGTAYDVTDFAETDSTTGQWVPKTPTGLVYGNNGFHLDAQPSNSADLLVSSIDRNDGDTLFADAAAGHTITRYGNTHHDNTVGNPFGSGTAISFDGTGDYLSVATSSDFDFGSGSYTYEGWFYFNGFSETPDGIFSRNNSSTQKWSVCTNSSGTLQFFESVNNSYNTSSFTFSTGQWYHIALCKNGTTYKVYVDGSEKISVTLSSAPDANLPVLIGRFYDNYNGYYLDGYCFDFRAQKGVDTGGSVPTAPFELNPVYIGGDQSGNKNHFTPTNISSHDVMLDTPHNNFATWNPLRPNAAMTYTEGNLAARSSGGSGRSGYSTFGITSGKWYFESLGCDNSFGLKDDGGSNYYIYYKATGIYSVNGSTVGSKSTYTTTDIISCAIDFDNETFQFYKNGVGQGQSSFSNTGISALKVEFAGTYLSVRTCYANFGQDSSFAGNKTAQGNADSNGYGDFYYTPPSNYLALCSANLDAPSVTPEENFNTVLYTGTRDNGNSLGATSNAVTGVGFNPELLWIKDRDNASSNYGSGYYGGYLFDAVQGTGKAINIDGDTYTGSNDFSSNLDGYNGVSSFDSDGFTVDEAEAVNYAYDSDYNGSLDGYERYVAWGWKLGSNGSSSTWASGNTDPTTEKYNASAGVSVIRQEETSSNYPMTGVTVNHSLGAAPEFAFLIDVTSNTSDIFAWHKDLDANKYLRLNADSAQTTGSGYFPSGCSTATTFQIGGDIAGANGMDGYWDIYLYLFSGVEGYSKFGSYEGNGSSNGPFVYTGFRPRFLMVKRLDSSAPWKIRDAARDPYNVASKNLDADSSGSEGDYTSNNIDLLSNGFKWRTSGSHENHNGHDYIYAAFAESPLKYSNAR